MGASRVLRGASAMTTAGVKSQPPLKLHDQADQVEDDSATARRELAALAAALSSAATSATVPKYDDRVQYHYRCPRSL